MTKQTDKLSAQRIIAKFNREAMANLRPEDTGIENAIIWISSGEYSGAKIQHGPRIKVMKGTTRTKEALKDAVTVRLTNPPEILGDLSGKLKKQVIKFVNENRDTLIRYWNFEIGTLELGKLLNKND